jgi:dihydrofolate reductase
VGFSAVFEEGFMSRVIGGMAMSLDGFVADREGRLDPLYPDLEALRHTEMLQELMRTTGAVVMGRHAYDIAEGDFTGYEFQVPIFVLTHHPPREVARGENERLSFTFVTDGIESAVRQAKAAAGDRDVTVIGGADTIAQCLRAGLLDELNVGIRHVLLGGGLRFFDEAVTEPVELELSRVIEMPGVTYLWFRVPK